MANTMKEAAKLHKEHPNWAWQKCVKEGGKKAKAANKVSGVKPKKKIGAVPKKKIVSGIKKKKTVSGAVKSVRKKSVGSIGRVGKAKEIMRDINRLETLRKREKNRDVKDIIQVDINALHDRLDTLKKR